MTELERALLGAIWIAALFGMRRQVDGQYVVGDRDRMWLYIYDIERELGNPPWPYTGPR